MKTKIFWFDFLAFLVQKLWLTNNKLIISELITFLLFLGHTF